MTVVNHLLEITLVEGDELASWIDVVAVDDLFLDQLVLVFLPCASVRLATHALDHV